MARRVSILGVTGSIGQNTLDLIARAPGAYQVVALTGGRNIGQLALDARRFGAELAVTAFPECLPELERALDGTGIETRAGPEALIEAAARPADWIMSAIVGAAGLAPGLRALEQGTTLALANKETLVCAGPLAMATAERHGARILPVDSEHSAIFQVLNGEDPARVDRVVITASGGALRDWALGDLPKASIADVSAHPNWAMGQRITIDSASMFNKGMELIETKEFFGIAPDRIEVLLHPESLVHALVGFADGGLIAHVGPHDMRHAIGYALNYPDRRSLPVDRLDLARIGTLRFDHPDVRRYPALRLARAVMARGGLSGAVYNAAKERALDGFLDGRIAFTDMAVVVEETLSRAERQTGLIEGTISLDNVLETDHLARTWSDEIMLKQAG